MNVIRLERLFDSNNCKDRRPLRRAQTAARRRLHIVTEQGTFALDSTDRAAYTGRNGARHWHWCICRGPFGEAPPFGLGTHVLGLRNAVEFMATGRVRD